MQFGERFGATLARALRLLELSVLCLLVGCGTPSHQAPQQQLGTGRLGDPCGQAKDCASGICVQVGATGGICSSACGVDGDCPHAANWGCVAANKTDLRVCGCRALGNHELCGDSLDNDCDGKIDDCRMCAGVAVPDDDQANCGACGNACRADQHCDRKACLCPAGLQDCENHCVDTSKSASDCGVCGHPCQPGEACVADECHCADGDDTACPGASCVALQSDVNNCGSCGAGCTLGQTCTNGKCACPNAKASDFCDGTGCVDIQTDGKNCGQCGNACTDGRVCRQGECGCPEGKPYCNGACVDLAYDEANCGECGQACGKQQACIRGRCGCDADGYAICGDACVDLATDTAHCGDCGNACKAGESCAAGSCGCQSQLFCEGACIGPADANNCGQCGHACSAVERCSQGSCVCDGFGLTACGSSSCVDLHADESNCGGCGVACRSGEHCYSGACQCPLGQTYCATAGTCVNLNSDTNHCGACGTACDPTESCSLGSCQCPASGARYCASQNACVDTLKNVQHCGGCDQSCKPAESCSGGKCGCATYGQTYCASTKACTDTLANTKHCGGCDKACRTGEICNSGECRCPPYQTWCESAKSCVDLSDDPENCGACGNACGGAQHCGARKCRCDDATLTLCSGTCYDLQTDEQHCGDCGTVCGSALSCKSGACKCQNPTVGDEVRVLNDAVHNWYPEAAWDGTNVGVVYLSSSAGPGSGVNVRFARIKPNGTLLDSTALTNFGTSVRGVVESPHVVWNGSEYGVLWVQDIDPSGLPQVMFRRVKATGAPAAAAVIVVKSDQTRTQTGGLAWSSPYGGYGTYYTKEGNNLMASVFRRLGTDALAPEAENVFTEMSRSPFTVRMATAPDGTWGISVGPFQLVNADGSVSEPTTDLGVSGALDYFYASPLIHDGKAFVTVGRRRIGTTNFTGVYLNRGSTANSPALLFTEPDLNHVYTEAVLAKAGESIALGLASRINPSDHEHLALQRYTIPETLTSAVAPLHDPVDLVTTDTLSDRGGDVALVATSPGHLLAIWADTRWGNKQLYARDIDLHSCP